MPNSLNPKLPVTLTGSTTTFNPESTPPPIGWRAQPKAALVLLLLVVAWTLVPGRVLAGNLLVNPGFELNSGHTVPTGWTYFSPPPPPNYFGNYWVEGRAGIAHSGLLYWKEWGALYNAAVTNVAGIYQDFSSAPGSTYQAGGWFYTAGGDLLGSDSFVWIEVAFLGSTSNLLALFKSDVFSASAGADTWIPYQVKNACDLSAPVSVGDPYFTTYAATGTVSQLVAPLGTSSVRYRFAYAQARNQGGSCYFDDALLDQVSGPVPPVISNLYPRNMIFVDPADGISFNVSSPSGFGIDNSAIHLVLNGTDVASNLVISGSVSNKTVAYHGLQSNQTYTVSITVTDAFHLTVNANTYFETTWVGVPPVLYLWEAEDFDFNNGMYFNHPDLCSTAGSSNCYFGTVGVEGVDEHQTGTASSHLYRPEDPVGTLVSGDYSRKDHVLAGAQDYRIDPFNSSGWLNYTRDWSNGTYWVIGRLATDVGLSGTITLSQINPDFSSNDLGTFTIAGGRGWSTFDNVYLKDTNGNNAIVTLNGKSTLRITSGGNLLPNFFMLVAAQPDLPLVTGLYPTGTHPFEYTNALRFTVTAFGATFPSNGITVLLDGTDVSSNLVINGSASAKDVLFPALLPNAPHLAVLAITNSLGHGIRLTNRFDTFSQDNYMVETEDFDYDGGQFVAPWFPEAYIGLGATTNIDFQHSPLTDETYPYRSAGVPQATAHDYLRFSFIDVGAFDYSLAWFGNGDWVNYTRVYPAGSYYVYIRTSGDGPFSMDLSQVVSGAGTTSQAIQRLGRWGAVGRDYQTYNWVLLTDEGQAAPAVIKLNGLATLRLSTGGNCNPNYFMLVPASGIPLTARRSAGNVEISFPSQTGVIYRVFYRSDLAAGNWTLLTTVLGDGAFKTVRDASTQNPRFYRVVAP